MSENPWLEALGGKVLIFICSLALVGLTWTTAILLINAHDLVAEMGWFSWFGFAILLPAIYIVGLVWGIVRLKAANSEIRRLQAESEIRQALQEQRREEVLDEIFPSCLSPKDTRPNHSG
jgi:hypothetical protein